VSRLLAGLSGRPPAFGLPRLAALIGLPAYWLSILAVFGFFSRGLVRFLSFRADCFGGFPACPDAGAAAQGGQRFTRFVFPGHHSPQPSARAPRVGAVIVCCGAARRYPTCGLSYRLHPCPQFMCFTSRAVSIDSTKVILDALPHTTAKRPRPMILYAGYSRVNSESVIAAHAGRVLPGRLLKDACLTATVAS